MSADSIEEQDQQSLEEAFPAVDPGIAPLGGRVVVQLRRLPDRTKGGLIVVEETHETAKWNNQVAKVISLGPLAYRNRQTREEWPEGAWVKPGDYIRVPRWNGDRIEVKVKGSDAPVIFVVFNDHEIITRITGNPLSQRIYIL